MAFEVALVLRLALLIAAVVPTCGFRASSSHEELIALQRDGSSSASAAPLADGPTEAGRRLAGRQSSLEESSDEAQVQLAAGHVLRGRYELHSFIGRVNLTWPEPGQDFPSYPVMGGKENKLNGFSSEGHLGRGSFGDVWKAKVLGTNEFVAVKIFYTGNMYITRKLLDGWTWMSGLVGMAKQECQDVIDLMKQQSVFAEGASHICRCLGEHISDAGSKDPLFVVQEMCGTSLKTFWDQGKNMDLKWDRHVIEGVLLGVSFLNKVSPPLVHHDLKLENVVVSDSGEAKLIDFGAMIRFNQAGNWASTACTVIYAPPEAPRCYQPPNFDLTGPSWAFDIWTVGVTYFELLSGSRGAPPEGLLERLENPALKQKLESEGWQGKMEDLEVVEALLQRSPALRPSPDDVLQLMGKRFGSGCDAKCVLLRIGLAVLVFSLLGSITFAVVWWCRSKASAASESPPAEAQST